MSRLDDTTGCPVADRCEVCGTTTDLTVVAARTVVGVLCQTLCPACTDAGVLLPLSAPETVGRVLDHHRHTGTTADDS